MMETPIFLWMIILPLLAAPLIYLSGHFAEKLQPRKLPYWLALLTLLGSWIPFGITAAQVNQSGSSIYTLGGISLQMDGLALVLAAVSLGLGTLVVIYSGPYMTAGKDSASDENQEKYYALLVAMIAVMIGLGCTADLFNLWIWFETMAISSYLLVAFYREQTSALEAGVKYLVQSAAGSVLVLIGISLVLTETGTLDLAEIQAVAASSSLMIVAGALFVIGFGVKAALVPLHTWLPDAHSQAPSGISAMLSGVVIEAGLIAMLRALSGLAFIEASWPALLMVFGALNMLLGNLMALRQTQIKRLLAYSSLAHVGYMLIGLGVALYFGNLNGAQGGFFHLFNHMLMKGLAFLAAGALLYALHLSRNSHAPLTKDDLAGAATRYPLVALTFSLAVLALGGLPPLAGFMSKWQIFVSGFQVENFWIGALVIFAALNSVLSLAYYAPLVNALYRMEPSARVREGALVPKVMQLPLAILALAVVVIGLWPALMNWLTVPAGAALLKVFGY
jgi:proton-translocating NADH-quinone oxidoreductase chain N